MYKYNKRGEACEHDQGTRPPTSRVNTPILIGFAKTVHMMCCDLCYIKTPLYTSLPSILCREQNAAARSTLSGSQILFDRSTCQRECRRSGAFWNVASNQNESTTPASTSISINISINISSYIAYAQLAKILDWPDTCRLGAFEYNTSTPAFCHVYLQ